MALRHLLPALPAVIVVDGYVRLPDARPGLGAHLYESLARCAAVVGIAKRPFKGIGASDGVLPVLRGASRANRCSSPLRACRAPPRRRRYDPWRESTVLPMWC